MDRKEFSNMLVEARKKAGKTRFDIGFLLRKPQGFCQRIENAQHNFKVRLAQECLDVIGYNICLYKNDQRYVIMSKSELSDWIKLCIKDFGGQSALSNNLGISRLTLSQAVSGKTDISIDSFLSIAEVCNYQVKIEKNSGVKIVRTKAIENHNMSTILYNLDVLGYTLSIYKSDLRYKKIQDKADMSLFLNQCVKSYGGKEKIANDLKMSTQHVTNIVSEGDGTVEDFKSLASLCGYEIKIEKV